MTDLPPKQHPAAARLLARTADWKQKECTLGRTRFRIEKMLPMQGFEVLEMVRSAVGDRFRTLSAETGTAGALISVILGIDPPALRSIMDRLFRSVHFTNANVKTPMVVFGNEGMAFESCQPIDVYELLARCLTVNFRESFSDLFPELAAVLSDSSP